LTINHNRWHGPDPILLGLVTACRFGASPLYDLAAAPGYRLLYEFNCYRAQRTSCREYLNSSRICHGAEVLSFTERYTLDLATRSTENLLPLKVFEVPDRMPTQVQNRGKF